MAAPIRITRDDLDAAGLRRAAPAGLERCGLASHAGAGPGAGRHVAYGSSAGSGDGPADAARLGPPPTTSRVWTGLRTGTASSGQSGCSRPSRRLRLPSGSAPGLTLPSTAWCAGAGSISRVRSRLGLASCSPSAASAPCCAGSASRGWWSGPATLGRTRRRRRLSGRLRRPRRRSPAGARPRQGAGALVGGRSPHRPAGHADADLGRARLASLRAARPALRLGVLVRSNLSGAWSRCCPGAADGRRRHDDLAPGRDRRCRDTWRPCRARPGRRRLAPDRRQAARPRQHHAAAPAAL